MSKAVVVGDLNVGKTCLINRYVNLKPDKRNDVGMELPVTREAYLSLESV